MTITVSGYAAQSANSPLSSFQFTRRTPRPDDVVIEILYCGVCHTDIHQARNEWHGSQYPVVPGHEIIGRVQSVGSEVTKFQPGDMAGVGCMVDSCRHCASCREGLEQYCEEGGPTWSYNDKDRHDQMPTYGGYSDRIVVTQDFAVPIPAGLDIATAAPLFCAGITTYSPLRHWQIGKGSKIAVVGLGGLGHMALKFAHALGAHTTLFTRTPGKTEEAYRLGADSVILSTDSSQMRAAASQFDFILDTVPNEHDLNPYLETLQRDGVCVLVGQLTPLQPPVAAGMLIGRRRAIAGSVIGGIAETAEMLQFCADNGIGCDVESIAIQQINEAYERMLKSDVRYRFVIDMASLKEG